MRLWQFSLFKITAFCLLALFFFSMADAAVLQKQDKLSRDFGYTIGDLVTRHIYLEIERPHELDREKIPVAGKLNRWLELRSIEFEEKYHARYTAYLLKLEYQIINSEVSQSTIKLPGFELDLEIPERKLPLVFQKLPLRMTRVTEEDPSRSLQILDLQAARAPEPVPVTGVVLKLLLSLIILILSLLMIVYLTTGLPWLRRLQGPFARASKKIRRLDSQNHNESIKAGVRYLHQAFNETNGKVLLHDDLPEFLQSHPAFNKISDELSELFAASRNLFFGEGENPAITLKALKHLCHQCRDIERGLG